METNLPAEGRRVKRVTAMVAVMALGAIGPACARSEPCSGEADCPHMVSHGGRDY